MINDFYCKFIITWGRNSYRRMFKGIILLVCLCLKEQNKNANENAQVVSKTFNVSEKLNGLNVANNNVLNSNTLLTANCF